jgi:hypothetical protein
VGRIDFPGYDDDRGRGLIEVEVVMSRNLDREKMSDHYPVAFRRSVR